MAANQSRMAIISPCHDTANLYVHNWMEPYLVPMLDPWELHKFYCEEARGLYHVFPDFEVYHPKGLFEHGHGSTNSITGHNSYAVWALWGGGPQYMPLLEDKIVYFISCYTGQGLGPAMVSEYGARAYMGYDDLCYVGYGGRWKECLLEPWIALVEGCTVGEAYQRGIDMYNWWIDQTGYEHLIHNRDHFVMFGDTDARLLEEEYVPTDSFSTYIGITV